MEWVFIVVRKFYLCVLFFFDHEEVLRLLTLFKLQVFLREDQTDPGVTEIIRCRQDQKIPVWNFQLHVVEDFAVISRSQETM